MVEAPQANRYALIGAGPMGLAMARVLGQLGIPFDGFELHTDVGGLWDIEGPRSTMYETAHLISSKRKTEFADFPMAEAVADYPSHREVLAYFRAFADHFDLRRHYRFGAEVTRTQPLGGDGEGWQVDWRQDGRDHSARYKGVLIANGTLSEPNRPQFRGDWTGEMLHSADYRSPRQFTGKRVLVVGAGNSGCDIAVDAIHHAERCDISLRRGYYFVPKYIFGRPADTVGGAIRLPMWLKRRIDGTVLRWFAGDPQRYGFPKPDYQLYEAHPVVNSLIIFHAGHGDIQVRPDIDRLDGTRVHFCDGTARDYDTILTATGYRLHYPFIDREHLNWQGDAPHLYLNCLHPARDDLFVLGMIEAAGLGWQGRHEQAWMVGRYIQALGSPAAARLRAEKAGEFARETGGMRYINLPRMAYYVDKESYLRALRRVTRSLEGAA
jgi:NADPH-dependent 2,4-dienoyl-CoA reductase/sulfur reductase-like enzyme